MLRKPQLAIPLSHSCAGTDYDGGLFRAWTGGFLAEEGNVATSRTLEWHGRGDDERRTLSLFADDSRGLVSHRGEGCASAWLGRRAPGLRPSQS
jgi:hypothetical protein